MRNNKICPNCKAELQSIGGDTEFGYTCGSIFYSGVPSIRAESEISELCEERKKRQNLEEELKIAKGDAETLANAFRRMNGQLCGLEDSPLGDKNKALKEILEEALLSMKSVVDTHKCEDFGAAFFIEDLEEAERALRTKYEEIENN